MKSLLVFFCSLINESVFKMNGGEHVDAIGCSLRWTVLLWGENLSALLGGGGVSCLLFVVAFLLGGAKNFCPSPSTGVC